MNYGRHYTLAELNALIDADRGPDGRATTDSHLAACDRCRNQFRELARIDRTLRRMPLPRPGVEFTANLMARISRGARTPLAFRLIEHGGSVLALLIVVTFLVTAYLWLGSPGSGTQQGMTGGLLDQGLSAAGELVRTGVSWLKAGALSTFGAGSLVGWVMFVAGGGILVALDRLIARRIARRVGG